MGARNRKHSFQVRIPSRIVYVLPLQDRAYVMANFETVGR